MSANSLAFGAIVFLCLTLLAFLFWLLVEELLILCEGEDDEDVDK